MSLLTAKRCAIAGAVGTAWLVFVHPATPAAESTTTHVFQLPGAELTDETSIRGGSAPDQNFSTAGVLATAIGDAPSDEQRVLLKFDVRTIPPASRITAAHLKLTVRRGGADDARRVGAFWVDRSFVAGEATWNVRRTGVPWHTPGGDPGAHASTAEVANTPGAVASFDVMPLLQEVVDGTRGSGWLRLLLMDVDAASRGSLREYESADSGGGNGPRLSVTFSPASAGSVTTAAAGAPDIVLYPSAAPVVRGTWHVARNAAAAGGAMIAQPDAGASKLGTPLASPTQYFEQVFEATAGIAYHVWLRGHAQSDSPWNDSVFLQFSGSVDSAGHAISRIGTSSAETVNLEDCRGCGLSGWGWQDNGWGVNVSGRDVRFHTTGPQRIRVQTREDGLAIDQIVLSPERYLSNPPGPLTNDATVLARAKGLAKFSHVFVIVFENREFNQIIGSTLAPYINSVAKQYGLATAFTAITHPSLPNYMALTGGATVFGGDCVTCRVDSINIADQVERSGRTWKGYMGAMPAPCTTVDSGGYAAKHNPFVHYTDIAANAARCQAHVVPLTDFDADLAANRVPNFVWITPDMCTDMHDCTAGPGDRWLSGFLPKILRSSSFANSVVYLVWDEGTTTVGGGGRIPLIVVGADSAPGVQSARAANHYNLLRTIEDAWGLTPLGNAASAFPLTEYAR